MINTCAVWGTPAAISAVPGGDWIDINSTRAGGRYRITGSAVHMVNALGDLEKAKLTTWLVNERRLGTGAPEITTQTIHQIAEMPRLRVSERLDRALLLLQAELPEIGQCFEFVGASTPEKLERLDRLCAWTESTGTSQVVWLLQQLATLNLLSQERDRWSITHLGWGRLEQLRAGEGSSTQAFVAMWFSPSLDTAYAEGFEPAIREVGYRPLRIDRKEHVNKIDDEIIAEIRRSRFLVADFTSEQDRARGGVYFEAGFAFGLNIPVVWTCRTDAIANVHFDTRQFNHIVWADPAELRFRLKNRIAAVLGYGLALG
ncbi:hypothetical protein BH10PSE9_BH10PSE9_00570 [soil metagenome]